MKDVNSKIAGYICLAQQASDAGKGRYIVFRKKDDKSIEMNDGYVRRGRRDYQKNKKNYAQRNAYSVKEEFILRAINLIRNTKSNFNYFIEASPDQNGFASYITYFDFKIEGKRFQVSFHTPQNLGKKLEKYINTGRKTRWDHAVGGSVIACQELIKYYNL